MLQGVLIACSVSFAWIFFQNIWMHVRPTENRFAPMLIGYVVSLPVVAMALSCFPAPATSETPWLGWIHAYLFHLLLFFCYVECFYHVERSVSLRLLVEILIAGSDGVQIEDIQQRYSFREMILDRLSVLCDRGFLDTQNGVYQLRRKGKLVAYVIAFAAWVFQSKGQHERS